MSDNGIGSALSKLDAVKDTLTVRRVFGDAYETGGATIIPVAVIRGGGGGGGGEGTAPDEQGSGSGSGVGFGVHARPMGVFVVKDGNVTWQPSIDVMRVVLGGQIVALVAIWTIDRVLSRRRRRT